MFWRPSARVAAEPSCWATLLFAIASGGIVARAIAASAIPIQLASGWSPAIELTHGLHPDICGDHPEADGDQAIGAPFRRLDECRSPPNRQSRMTPAGDSTTESAPNPIKATEPAATGANGEGGFDRMPPEPEASKTLGASDELWTPGLRAGGNEGEGCVTP